MSKTTKKKKIYGKKQEGISNPRRKNNISLIDPKKITFQIYTNFENLRESIFTQFRI